MGKTITQMKNRNAWLITKLDCKSRVCADCNKRKPITEFHFQKPKYQHKIKQVCIDRRRECKACHYKKSMDSLLKRTTANQRAKYQKKYHKTYIQPLMYDYQFLKQYAK